MAYVFQILTIALISLVLAGMFLRKVNGVVKGVSLRTALIGAFCIVVNLLSAVFVETSVLAGASAFVIGFVGGVTAGVAIATLKIEKVRLLLGYS